MLTYDVVEADLAELGFWNVRPANTYWAMPQQKQPGPLRLLGYQEARDVGASWNEVQSVLAAAIAARPRDDGGDRPLSLMMIVAPLEGNTTAYGEAELRPPNWVWQLVWAGALERYVEARRSGCDHAAALLVVGDLDADGGGS